MTILHYFLGFSPYRSGGLTRYATDLMEQQVKDGHEVSALWPGKIALVNSKVSIRKHGGINGINNFELINPLPVSLDEGIWDTEAYTKGCDKRGYKVFLQQIRPDVIHIHTLMGLHKEFVEIASELRIRMVFTTHDYFGICPKATLYRYGEVCDNDHGCKDCIQCNVTALSIRRIQIMQSSVYRQLKDAIFVKILRKQHRIKFFNETTIPEIPDVDINLKMDQYNKLRSYYVAILEKVDMIHFNSSVAAKVYNRYLKPKNSRIVSITHKNVSDHRKESTWKYKNKLRITYLAPTRAFKGFEILREALEQLWNEGNKDIQLNVFGPVKEPAAYMNVKDSGYLQEELLNIMNETDVLVAPSIWYETFGFTVLEALSYGTPVIVSDHMGAKDIIGNAGIIIEAGSIQELKETIGSLTEECLKELRYNVQNNISIKMLRDLSEETYQLYKE